MNERCVICGHVTRHDVDREEALKEMLDGHAIFGDDNGTEYMWGWCGCDGKSETVYKDVKIGSSYLMKINAVPDLRERNLNNIIVNNYTRIPVLIKFSVRMPMYNNWREILQLNVPPGHVYETRSTTNITFARGVGDEVQVEVCRDQVSYAIKGGGYGVVGGEANTTSTGTYMGVYNAPPDEQSFTGDQITMKVIYQDIPIYYLVEKFNKLNGVK